MKKFKSIFFFKTSMVFGILAFIVYCIRMYYPFHILLPIAFHCIQIVFVIFFFFKKDDEIDDVKKDYGDKFKVKNDTLTNLKNKFL